MSIDARQVKLQALSTSNSTIAVNDTLEDVAGKAQGQISAIQLTPTAVKTSAYPANAGELVKTDATIGAVPVTLPTAPADKTRVAVKMIAVSGTNTTTIATGGTDVFNKTAGSTSISLTLLNQSLVFQYEAATGIWSVTSGDIPLSQLDARFATTAQVTANTSNITKILTRPPAKTGSLGTCKIAGFLSQPNYSGSTLSNGTDTAETSRFNKTAIGIMYDLQLVFSNCPKVGTASIAGMTDITITASIEYPSATFTQVTFNNSTSYLLRLNRLVTSDPINIEIPDGASFWVRTCVTVTAGQKWIRSHATNTSRNEGITSGSDVTMSGTITNSTTNAYSCSAILGNTTTNKASVLLIGDSLASGQNDTGTTTYGTNYTGGLYGRAFANSFPVLSANFAGQQIAYWASNRSFVSQLFATCHYFICQLGINDISINTLATIQTQLIAQWDTCRIAGVYGYQTTITPRTTSTDTWATTANQTVTANESIRVSLNNWFRDGAPIHVTTRAAVAVGDAAGTTIRAADARHPLLGYFEIADIAETARNSGIWKVGYTGDGLHGNSTSYPLMAAAIDTTKFLLWS